MWKRSTAFFAPEDGTGGGGSSAAPAGGAGDQAAGTGAGAAPVMGDFLKGAKPETVKLFQSKGWDKQSVDQWGDGYYLLEKRVGNSITPPGKDAKPEEWDAFHAHVRPEKVENYKIPDKDGGYSDGDKAFHAAILPLVHQAGLSQRQIDILVPGWNKYAADVLGQANAAGEAAETKLRTEATAQLKKEQGANFPAFVDHAQRGARFAFGEDFDAVANLALKDGGKLGDHPLFLKGFARVDGAMAEDSPMPREGYGYSTTPAAAKAEKEKLMADENFRKAFGDKEHREHDAAVARIHRLNTVIRSGDK